jgi:uncharacterized protein (TIGR03067 family)
MKRSWVFIFAAAWLIAADNPKKDDPKKSDDIAGTWTVTRAYTGADEASAEDTKRTTVLIKGKSLIVSVADQQNHEATIKLDSSKNPREIDLVPKDGRFMD